MDERVDVVEDAWITQEAVDDPSTSEDQESSTDQGSEELAALARLFAIVRERSSDGKLLAPSDWESSDLIPAHMDAEAFEMFTYEYLEEQKAQKHAAGEVEDAAVYRTATRAVGVPQMFAAKAAGAVSDCAELSEREGADGDVLPECAEAHDADTPATDELRDAASGSDDLGFDIPEGFELVELEGELTLIPIEMPAEDDALVSDDITVLVGKRSYYLYSNTVMTDTFAHWAFLAQEDDRIITFVDCVRSESRTYPRPMAASGLMNDPFNMTDEEIEQTYNALCESGEYPDIETTVASNGEVYYFSTEYLSAPYAASLAEWHAVERAMYL